MPICYVLLHSKPSLKQRQSRVCALMLADLDGKWPELEVREDTHGGYGVHPAKSNRASRVLNWKDLAVPVLLPYIGKETVVKHKSTLETLMKVLKGDFMIVTIAEVQQRHGVAPEYVANGVFAVPQLASVKWANAKLPLPPETGKPPLEVECFATRGRVCALL